MVIRVHEEERSRFSTHIVFPCILNTVAKG